MKHNNRWTAGFAISAMIALPALVAAKAQADDTGPSAATTLPLHDVVLFSSGVGYFQRSGHIGGSATIPLSFRTEQVNDILKSLVLFDPAGEVEPVTYTTKDSLSRRLQASGLALNNSETLGDLLRRFQGARVRLDLGNSTLEGRILSVSVRNVPVPSKSGGDSTVPVEVLNILTDGGLRAVPLDQVTQVSLLDTKLDNELRESLSLLAGGLDDEKQAVELHFGGATARDVRAGYLQEMPVWKTSYRLVLAPNDKPYLQGWAVVENTTDEDWKDVRLSLVSGRPISFIEDLYQPLYVPRPVVPPQVIGSPASQTYGEATEEAKAIDASVSHSRAVPAPPRVTVGMGIYSANGGANYISQTGNGAVNAPMAMAAAQGERADMAMSAAQMGIAAQAQGTQRGDLFEYAIREPVTLPRQQAAMVPIVGEAIEGDKISIYDADTDATQALNGFRLKNSTGLHLAGGPITVYQDGVYAGDAQMNNVQPGDSRLISYAVDLDLVANRQGPNGSQLLVSLSARNGVLVITRKQRNARLYSFRNKSDAAKVVLVQQALEPDFSLLEPKEADEKTATDYRFKVEVPAKKSVDLRVVTEQPLSETVALLDMDFDQLVEYTKNGQASDKLKAALGQVVALRRKVANLQAERAEQEAELAAINQEQSRIRQNMVQLDHNSALYQQYVTKLTDQEGRIDKLQTHINDLHGAETAAQNDVQTYVDTLTVD